MPSMDKLRELTQAFDDKNKRRILADDPAIKEIKKNEAFQRLMKDTDFQTAAEQKQWGAILNNESFRKAVNDPEIREFLSNMDLKSHFDKVDGG